MWNVRNYDEVCCTFSQINRIFFRSDSNNMEQLLEHQIYCFELLTVVKTKTAVFYYLTSCSLAGDYPRLGTTYGFIFRLGIEDGGKIFFRRD
jgi:hypothetical protein